MKNFDDLTNEELTNLSSDEVNYYIDVECAEQGIKLLPPGGPPTKPDKGTTADDLELWQVADNYFRDREDAERVSAAIAASKSRVTLDYISGPSYRKKAVPATDSVSSINMIRVLSQERAAELSALIDEQERVLGEYNKRSTEYEKIVRERRNVVNSIRERIEKAAQKVRRKEELSRIAARYVELANGDKFMAARFLRRAEPDVDEYLIDLPDSEGLPVAKAPIAEIQDDIQF
jgi:ElaB/YqjD/DUF883 family membrane-anchored ribosome-binding protein